MNSQLLVFLALNIWRSSLKKPCVLMQQEDNDIQIFHTHTEIHKLVEVKENFFSLKGSETSWHIEKAREFIISWYAESSDWVFSQPIYEFIFPPKCIKEIYPEIIETIKRNKCPFCNSKMIRVAMRRSFWLVQPPGLRQERRLGLLWVVVQVGLLRSQIWLLGATPSRRIQSKGDGPLVWSLNRL